MAKRTAPANPVRTTPEDFDRLPQAAKAAQVRGVANAVAEALSLPAALTRRAHVR